MVGRLLRSLHTEFTNTHSAALLLGGMSFVGQVLGLIRDRAFVYVIGPSKVLDIYYIAFRIPDLLFITVGSLVSITVLIPFLLQRFDTTAHRFFNHVFSVFITGICILAVILFFALPSLAPIIAPGFTAADHATLVMLARVMLLQPIFLGLSNLFGSITQLYKKFVLWALAPVLYNLGLIIGVTVLYPLFGIIGLAYGVVLAGILHMSLQLYTAIRQGFIPRFTALRNIAWSDMRAVFTTSVPRTLGLALSHITTIIIVAIATTLPEGSVTLYTLAYSLQSVPLTLVGMSYSVAVFPVLAESFAKGDRVQFITHTGSIARQILFWSLPIAALFIVLRAHIVRVILGTGAFTWDHTRITAAALALFALSIAGQGIIQLCTRAYYAAGNTRTPLRYNSLSSIVIIILSQVLLALYQRVPEFASTITSLLRISDIAGADVVMLSLAFSLGTLLNLGLYIRGFSIDFGSLRLLKTGSTSVIAAVAGAVGAYGALSIFAPLYNQSTFIGILSQGILAGVIGVLCWGIVLRLLRSPELDIVLTALFRKVKPSALPVQDAEL